MDIVGIIIERVTNHTLEEYFRENILEPLNIKDFSFYVPKNKMPRLVALHNRGSDGLLEEGLHPIPVISEGEREIMHMGGSGGFTTMIDYASKLLLAFFIGSPSFLSYLSCDVIINNTLDLEILAAVLCGGVSPTTKQRILGSNMIELMVQNQIPHMPDFARKGLEDAIPFLTNNVPELYPQPGNPPQGWSMGGMLTLEADGRPGRKKNTVHWCGTPNLFWWLDIESGVAGILATQIFPFFGMCKLVFITNFMTNV
jgi:CubicO group peptidase (beta-lactamase class C family)